MQGIETQGVGFYVGDVGSPEAFTRITGCTDIKGLDQVRKWIETHSLESVVSQGRASSLKMIQPLAFDVIYDPDVAVHATLDNAFKNNTQKRFRIELTDSTVTTKYDFSGQIIKRSMPFPMEDKQMVSFEVGIDGDITLS